MVQCIAAVHVDLEPVRRLRILVCRERRGHRGERLISCETFASYTSPRLDGGTEVSGRMRLIREPACRTSVRLQRIRPRIGRLGQDGVSDGAVAEAHPVVMAILGRPVNEHRANGAAVVEARPERGLTTP